MTTITVVIGNSDDKLSQPNWSYFCSDIYSICKNHTLINDTEMYFRGYSNSNEKWQNSMIVLESTDDTIDLLREKLIHSRKRFGQESLAFITGTTQLI